MWYKGKYNIGSLFIYLEVSVRIIIISGRKIISLSLFSLNQGIALLIVELPLAILLYALIISLKFFSKPNMRVLYSD